MTIEALRFKITNHIEIRKYLWTSLIAVTAGISALFLSLDNIQKVILFVLGIMGDISIVFFISVNNKLINSYIIDLQTEEK